MGVDTRNQYSSHKTKKVRSAYPLPSCSRDPVLTWLSWGTLLKSQMIPFSMLKTQNEFGNMVNKRKSNSSKKSDGLPELLENLPALDCQPHLETPSYEQRQ